MCVSCGMCVPNCPQGALSFDKEGKVSYDETKCVACDTCIHVCPHDSTPRTHLLSVEEVYEKVRKQIPFIRGITVSGGECMLRPDFLTELFRMAKADGLTTLIDSNGTIDFSNQNSLLEVTDGVMLDIKAFEESDHYRVTDASNQMVLANGAFLAKEHKLYEVRAVIVPDLYDTTNSVRKMGNFLRKFYEEHPFRIKLIAYRPMGVREAYAHYEVPSQSYLEELAQMLKDMGYEDIIII